MSCKCPEWIPEYQAKQITCKCTDCDTDVIIEFGSDVTICRKCLCNKSHWTIGKKKSKITSYILKANPVRRYSKQALGYGM